MNALGEVELAPDGERAVFTVHATAPDDNRPVTQLWLLDVVHNSPARKLLQEGGEIDMHPLFGAHGRSLYLISARSGSRQVWRLDLGGEQLIQITQLPLEVTTFRVSPRADRIFVTLDVFRNCVDLPCTVKRLNDAAASERTGKYYDELPIRRWNTWDDGRRMQLFSIGLDAQGIANQVPVKLSIDIEGDVPTRPVGGRETYSLSPDGESLVFSERSRRQVYAWDNRLDLYRVLASGGQRLPPDGRPGKDADPVELIEGEDQSVQDPCYSPDGMKIAYIATERTAPERSFLAVLDVKTGVTRSITGSWDASIRAYSWASDGRHLYATADYLGQRPLFEIDARSGSRRQLTQEGTVESFSVQAGRVVAALSSLSTPAELYSVQSRAPRMKQLTHLGDDVLAQRRFGATETFAAAGWSHERVQSYLVAPVDRVPGRRYPLLVLLHDLPNDPPTNSWKRWVNAQVFAAAGVGVLIPEFHGSSGYGADFARTVDGDWASKPLEDIHAAIEAASNYSWVDGDRLDAAGLGYGAYLVNLMAGEKPARFYRMISHAGWIDNRALYYSTDEWWVPERALGGPEYDASAHYARQNPLDRVKDWTTPMLFTHGEQDFHVPYTESVEAFTAMQRHQAPSRLLLVPDEGHWISKRGNLVQWYSTALKFLK
jgi:dipeptidyl aminopeptidase/acylaminoacyl peptidase